MSKQTDTWRKASYSANGTDCVEVGDQANGVLVRDTKARDVGTLTVSADDWRRFTARLKVGQNEL